MHDLIIRPSLEKHLDVSDEVLSLFGNFLTLWKERTFTDIDVIEARRIFSYMVQEDKKSRTSHIGNVLAFNRHSWVVGEYARGVDCGLIDIIILGSVNLIEFQQTVNKTSKLIKRKIRFLVVDLEELKNLSKYLDLDHALKIWGDYGESDK
mgnify:CR=1 FL=1